MSGREMTTEEMERKLAAGQVPGEASWLHPVDYPGVIASMYSRALKQERAERDRQMSAEGRAVILGVLLFVAVMLLVAWEIAR